MADPFKRDTEKVSVYLPPDIKAKLSALATANTRSLNGEVVVAIVEHLEAAERREVLPRCPHQGTVRR